MEEYDKPHAAPSKSLTDKVIEMALSAGGGAVTLMSGLLAAVLMLYSGYVLYDTFNTQQNAASSAWDLLRFKPEIFEDSEAPLSSDDLATINADYRCWLTVFDTNIDYPVVQGENDLYYASHDIYQRPNLTGAIYLAAGNSPDFSDNYNVIYGHHMDNGAMFGGLDKMTGTETGLIITKKAIYDVAYFAIINTDAYESRVYSVGDRMDDVLDFLRSGGAGGVGLGTQVTYFNEAIAANATKVVALSTCANASTNGRLVVFGRMTERVLMKDVTVIKVWEDENNRDQNRPASLTITASDGTEVVLTPGNNWTATVSMLKYDDDGEIQYTWTEETVQGYTLTSNVTEGDTTTLTNTLDTATARIRKVWMDEDNRAGVRPADLTVYLLDTAASAPRSAVLSPENDWTVEFTGLPRFVNGKEVSYSWVEPEVPGYLSEFVTEGSLTTLTNTLLQSEEEPEEHTLHIDYVLIDGTPVADPYEEEILAGEPYDVESPVLEGYKPTLVRVVGTMPNRDLYITVLYVPEDMVTIDDIETPLGLGQVNVNIGDCLE